MIAPRVSFLPSSLLTNSVLLQGGRPEADYPDLGEQQILSVFVVLSSQLLPLPTGISSPVSPLNSIHDWANQYEDNAPPINRFHSHTRLPPPIKVEPQPATLILHLSYRWNKSPVHTGNLRITFPRIVE